jgi:uncharacterized damage-inducible protein DinB
MQYYGGKELAIGFRTVRNNTIKIAEEIAEEQYGFTAAPDVRSVGQLLTHIAFVPSLQMETHQAGLTSLQQLNFPAFMAKMGAEEAKPRTKAEIIQLLTTEGEAFASYLEGLSDEFLAEPVAMMPGDPRGSKSRFEMLLSPKEHEMHHRGQLMLIERMLGIVPHVTRAMMERLAARAAAASR